MKNPKDMKGRTAREKLGNQVMDKKLVGGVKTRMAHATSATKGQQRRRDIKNA